MDPALEQAIDLFQTGDLDKAEQLCRALSGRNPFDAHALDLLGVIAGKRGDLDGGADLCRKAIAIDGSVANFHNHLGILLKLKGDLEGPRKPIKRRWNWIRARRKQRSIWLFCTRISAAPRRPSS